MAGTAAGTARPKPDARGLGLPERKRLQDLAQAQGLPPLLLLALDDELQRLTRSAQSLALASRGDGVRP
ncbi:MAG: hypothetical protein ABR96_09340 [cyanobacterium BACL30 MAG-120619-bin27]|nr:MAG: hypothetical protein ABR96_09340 [cyanobacterium BACL30 MAG-120619-bin27]